MQHPFLWNQRDFCWLCCQEADPVQGGYGSHRDSGVSWKSVQAFISTSFSLHLFGNEPCFTRSILSSPTDLCALLGFSCQGFQSESARRKSHTRSICPWEAVLLDVSRVSWSTISMCASGCMKLVVCPPLVLVAICSPLFPGLQGHVLATTSAGFFVSGKQIRNRSCDSRDSDRLSSGGAECLHTPLSSSTAPSQTSLQRYSKPDW